MIGILAAIATPLYLGQQRSARDASVITDVNTTTTMVTRFAVDNPRTAVASTGDYVNAGGTISRSGDNVLNVTTAGGGNFTVCGYGPGGNAYTSSTKAYLYDSTTGKAVPSSTCPGDGVASSPSPSPSASGGTSTGGTTTGGTTGGGTTAGGGTTTTPSASPSASAGPSASAAAWVDCAGENETCSFTGTRLVRYGLSPSSYVTRTLTGGTPCTNDVFGDPAYGYAKRCSYQ